MPLEGPDQLRLRAAHGYIELEMFEEVNAELEEIAFCRHLPEVAGGSSCDLSRLEKMGSFGCGRKETSGMESAGAGLFR
jgi:hypothetical protein